MFCGGARAWVRSWSMLQRKPEAEHLERRNDGVAKRSNEWKYKMVVSARGGAGVLLRFVEPCPCRRRPQDWAVRR